MECDFSANSAKSLRKRCEFCENAANSLRDSASIWKPLPYKNRWLKG